MAEKTYILLQPSNFDSRLWLDFPTTSKGVNALCERFEQRVSELNPNLAKVTYELRDLYGWLDNMAEVFALVQQPGRGTFQHRDRKWLKEQIALHLQTQAAG